ncbi:MULTISPECIES: lysozyme inhibitor LprI family protein [unclassified Pseudomonas]|uniref:lysozyme inhibitor LprI family protein n=1 Tax=unclassified Pseudomonas TaxID=196821 RepID=UPI00200F26A5|nr:MULTISPECIES: lysozyme inhibitor LprI family protein [unclassified Pseudomonas]
MHIKGRYIVSAGVLLFLQQAMATGMDCTKAVNTVENTICADKGLYELDAQMGVVYRGLMKNPTDKLPDLKRTQRLWLKARNECAEDISCLGQSYRERLQLLQAQWKEAVVYKPNEIDQEVLEDLQKNIRAASKIDPEFALERTLDALSIKNGQTSFSAEPDDDQYSEKTHFPKTIPKGVGESEWSALQASNLDADTELGQTSFTLLDLDGDGHRDLIVQIYTGGTGLFTFIETYRRDGDRFIRRTAARGQESVAGSSLYSINDRGANQSVSWISIHGKVYAAYRDSGYGIDQVYLLSPLQINRQVPTVKVRYRYQLHIPLTQQHEDSNTTYKLKPELQRALAQGLVGMDQVPSDSTQERQPICPIPPSAKDVEEYYSYGAGYYAIESVADFPVIIGTECFIARLNNWFGTYSEKRGLFGQLTLRKPGSGDEERSYEVNGRRRIIEISTSIGEVGGGAAE